MSERESKNATNMSIRINNIQGEISDSSQVPAKVGKDEQKSVTQPGGMEVQQN
jgi:hypothetical protein